MAHQARSFVSRVVLIWIAACGADSPAEVHRPYSIHVMGNGDRPIILQFGLTDDLGSFAEEAVRMFEVTWSQSSGQVLDLLPDINFKKRIAL